MPSLSASKLFGSSGCSLRFCCACACELKSSQLRVFCAAAVGINSHPARRPNPARTINIAIANFGASRLALIIPELSERQKQQPSVVYYIDGQQEVTALLAANLGRAGPINAFRATLLMRAPLHLGDYQTYPTPQGRNIVVCIGGRLRRASFQLLPTLGLQLLFASRL